LGGVSAGKGEAEAVEELVLGGVEFGDAAEVDSFLQAVDSLGWQRHVTAFDQGQFVEQRARGISLKWDGRRTEFSDLSAADCPNYDRDFEQFNQRGNVA
jgi:hypothetical protein